MKKINKLCTSGYLCQSKNRTKFKFGFRFGLIQFEFSLVRFYIKKNKKLTKLNESNKLIAEPKNTQEISSNQEGGQNIVHTINMQVA